MKDSKNLVIGMLCAVICVMAVAYAAFSTTLNINGTATIDSNWCVQIKEEELSCTPTPVDGGKPGSVTATATRDSGVLATVTMKFTQPGDKAVCTIHFENCGDLDAKLNSINVTGEDEEGPIKFTVAKPSVNDVLEASGDEQHTVTITGTYDSTTTSQPTSLSKTVKVVAEYVQNVGAGA